jgi:hypothetical protein
VSPADRRDAWADFWSAEGEQTATCLPQALSAIDATQDRLWTSFAAALPKRARVLDLGTGSGAVLKRRFSMQPAESISERSGRPIALQNAGSLFSGP